jgi:hypothetical protein
MAYTHSRYKAAPPHVEIDTPAAHIVIDKATAQRDVERAMESGDFKAQSDAYRRLSKIESAEERAQRGVSIDIDHSKDDASEAFQKQIDALRKSEDIQRQRQQLAKQHGLTPNQAAFLHHNPSFPHHPEVAKRALMLAHAEGHPEDSDAFHTAVHNHFHHEIGTIHSDELVKRGSMRPPETEPEEEPPTKPKRKVSMDIDDDVSAPRRFYSAPVSRETRANGYGGSAGNSPGRITLNAEQKSMAKTLGQTEVEYARGLLEMRERDKEYGR